mgnify:CR=1 FL=1
MPDPIDDLSALRIERPPLDPTRRSWGKWVVVALVAAGIGGGGLCIDWTTPIVLSKLPTYGDSGTPPLLRCPIASPWLPSGSIVVDVQKRWCCVGSAQ